MPYFKVFFPSILVLFSFSCAPSGLLNRPENSVKAPLSFEKVITLSRRTSSLVEVMKEFGVPSEILNLPEQKKLWSFMGADSTGKRIQRIGLVVNPGVNLVESWTWVVVPGESLYEFEAVASIFGGKDHFRKKIEWTKGRDESHQEISFENQSAGVSVALYPRTLKVSSIGWNAIVPHSPKLAENQ